MSNEELIKRFMDLNFVPGCDAEEAQLVAWESFKERGTENSLKTADDLYKEFARRYLHQVKLVCLLRQYEEFKAKQLIALN